MNDRRTYFGRQALKIMTQFFETEPYKDNPKAIAKYARWAIKADGPAIWETPTPINCTVPPTHPDYIVSLA